MTRQWRPPANRPISPERARELISGDLGKVYRKILMDCCAPFYWSRRNSEALTICNNGTLTIVRTSERLIGVTARHVVQGYLNAREKCPVLLKVMNAETPDLKVLAMSSASLDLATIEFDEHFLSSLGKEIVPPQWLAPIGARGRSRHHVSGLSRHGTNP